MTPTTMLFILFVVSAWCLITEWGIDPKTKKDKAIGVKSFIVGFCLSAGFWIVIALIYS
jgi:hypothetical protein